MHTRTILATLAGGLLLGACEPSQSPPSPGVPPGFQEFRPTDRVHGGEPDPGVVMPPRAQPVELGALPTEPPGRPPLPGGTGAVVVTPSQAGTIIADLPPSGCRNPSGDGEDAAAWEASAKLWKWLGFSGCPSNGGNAGEGASFSHAAFVARYGHRNRGCFPDNSTHLQSSDCRGFSGRTFVDRWKSYDSPPDPCAKPQSEIIAPADLRESGPHGVQRLVDAPFHRTPFLRSDHHLPSWGWMEWCEWEGLTWECDYATVGVHASFSCNPPNTVNRRQRTFYPMPGEQRVPNTWDGRESPQPPPPPAGYPSGYPISIQRPRFVVTGTALCLVESDGSCTHVPHNAVLKSNSPPAIAFLFDEGEAFLYAHLPTRPSRVYRVQFFGFDLPDPGCAGCQGTPAAPWWEFRTRDW